MRLCRFEWDRQTRIGIFEGRRVVDLAILLEHISQRDLAASIAALDDLIPLLPPDSSLWHQVQSCERELAHQIGLWHSNESELPEWFLALDAVQMLPPISLPNKLLLLAGNYVEHVREQGGVAAERDQTFPYVFSKPASTTLLGSSQAFTLPKESPNKIDYELELAVVIGRRGRNIPEAEALEHIAGYTVINDISDREYRPNPGRIERPRDKHFDWLHGKWHDGSCPCGPCMTTVDAITDPNQLQMQLRVDGEIRQDASTNLQVFSVPQTIQFISHLLTLEPGDIISTGTPAGVGNATGKFLRHGQRVEATIQSIGTLVTHIRSSSN
jgi:2-keto-4-pentenoate hydratase/2-oxohepta-3-ene-1,7-dioic acid hydratase in catechol pathway